MAAREGFKERLGKLHQDTVKVGRQGIGAAALLLGAEAAIHFLLAATLAGGVVFERFAPLGVAVVAGSGSGLCGGAALLGAALGYLTLLGFSDGLRYLSAAILTFAAAFAFSDLALLRRPWTMPLASGVINGFAGFLYLSKGGWDAQRVICFTGEIVLTVLVAWACHRALLPPRQGEEVSTSRRAAAAVLACAVLVALAPLQPFRGVSLGRSLAVTLVLAVAWKRGAGAGVILGVAAGLALDMARAEAPLYAAAFGVAALAAGLGRGKPRLFSAVAYVLGNAGAVLWTWNLGLPLGLLYEVFLGTVLFMVTPLSWMKGLDTLLARRDSLLPDSRGTQRARRKLEETSGAFRTLCDSLRASLRPPENDNDVACVFDRAAARVCRRCSLRGKCWERDYVTTVNALNDATTPMLARGRGLGEDFPRYFADRCIHFPGFLEAVNGELTALLYRRQYNSRIRESRAAVVRQYQQLSGLLGDLAVELGRELTPAPAEEARLRQRLALLGLEGQVTAFRDHRGLLRAEVRGDEVRRLAAPEEVLELSRLLKLPLRAQQEEEAVTLIQQEPLVAVAGVAARKKDGETVSGDAGTYFKGEDGKLYLLLCDGMGSGPEAHRESTLAVRLLEQFLKAGVGAEQALVTLSSALGLRGEETGGFTTVDLLQVDLFTGEAALYKLGAAPTYLKKGETVRRISGSSLPAGTGAGEPSAPDRTKLRLEPGDCVLMVSDGVAGTGPDDWIQARLSAFDGRSPKELACALITDSPEGATDDRTALVVRVGRRT